MVCVHVHRTDAFLKSASPRLCSLDVHTLFRLTARCLWVCNSIDDMVASQRSLICEIEERDRAYR